MIELRSLGTAEIRTPSAALTPAQEIAFAAALYLTVERGKPLSRAKLMSLLWPDIEPSAQGHRLRQTIYQLKALGVVPRSDRQVLMLPREEVQSDMDDSSISAAISGNQSVMLEFLPGYHPRLSDEFEAWLDALRDQVHSAITRGLVIALRDARNAGSWADVERIAAHCIRLDPYNEAAVLAQAEAYAMRGQKASALSILNRFVEDVSPNERALVLPAAVLRRRILQSNDLQLATRLATNDPDFVGRADEMRSLSQLIERTSNGRGGGCLLVGEPGIGKTRLSLEAAKFAELQGFKIERVSCKRSDTDQPLSAFVSLIPKLRELPGALGCSRETLAWLTRLTEFNSFPKALESPADDSLAIYTYLRTAVFDLLDAIVDESSVLVIVEDVQWLDRASEKLFSAIIDWAASRRLFLLFNARDDSPVLREAVTNNTFPVIELRPLGVDEAVALVRAFASGASELLDGPTIGWFITAAEGNPYFLQELIKHRLESGHRHTIPPSVATVLNERLSRLSDVARHLLQACAVLNENSDLARLERVLKYAPHELLAGIQELNASAMLRTTTVGKGVAMVFVRHDLLSNQVLSGLDPTALAYLHRRCALVLEQEALGTSASISLARACAFHWYQSGYADKAHDLSVRCADHLLELGLAVDAAVAFEGALSFCSSQRKQFEILRRIVHAYRMANDRMSVLQAIARIRSVQMQETGPIHDDLEIIEFETLRTTATTLRPIFARALACAYDESLPARHRVEAATEAAKLASGLPDLSALAHVYQSVLPLLGDDIVPVRARLQLQVIYNTMCGDLRQAVAFARERIAFEEREGTISFLINAMTDLSFVLRRTGPIEEALDIVREGYAIADKHKHYAAARDCAERLASMFEDEGREGFAEWRLLAAACGEDRRGALSPFSAHFDSVRSALRDNRIQDARRELESGFDWHWLAERRIWLAAATGLQIRLLIAERARESEVKPHVDRMLDLCCVTAELGRQDYEIAGLLLGLEYIGERSAASECLHDYLSQQRRDLTPLSKELLDAANRHGLAGDMDASRKNDARRTQILTHAQSEVG
jgi:DNA-binding SARP family transcriptional activator